MEDFNTLPEYDASLNVMFRETLISGDHFPLANGDQFPPTAVLQLSQNSLTARVSVAVARKRKKRKEN